MKTAEVKKLGLEGDYPDMEMVSGKMDELKEKLRIDTLNWKGYNYKPEVILALAYSEKEIFLKYYVTEDYFKAEKTETNEMVCEDSCVEFFVSPADDGIYYNLEFNAIGTCLLGTGTGRENSTRANPEIVSRIRRLASTGNKPFGEITGRHTWTLTLAIPFDVFFHHDIK
ncbi:MAG TPA: carbohydrate-binding family 9-like protein, partial [Bacteroidales bacterium]|nr:carbohydrate-binding family 9-like protein [Bacteroidales bacterium]